MCLEDVMVRLMLVVGVFLAVLLSSCASAEEPAGGGESSSTISTSTPSTTFEAPTSSSTSVASSTTTTSQASTTTMPPDPAVAASWIGVNFLAEAEGFQQRDEILKNVLGSMPVDLMVDGEPAKVYPWFSGFTSRNSPPKVSA